MLCVTDTGCGMDAPTLGHLNQPFFTSKEAKAAGVGLTMVRRILCDLGGSLDIWSGPWGTQVEILLPLDRPTGGGAEGGGVLQTHYARFQPLAQPAQPHSAAASGGSGTGTVTGTATGTGTGTGPSDMSPAYAAALRRSPSSRPTPSRASRPSLFLELDESSECALLVDPDPEARQSAGQLLGLLGYRVITAATEGEALGQLEQHRRTADLKLVFLEITTPAAAPAPGGPQLRGLFERIRRATPLASIVLVRPPREAAPSPDLEAELRSLLRSGAAGLLRKPYRLEALTAARLRPPALADSAASLDSILPAPSVASLASTPTMGVGAPAATATATTSASTPPTATGAGPRGARARPHVRSRLAFAPEVAAPDSPPSPGGGSDPEPISAAPLVALSPRPRSAASLPALATPGSSASALAPVGGHPRAGRCGCPWAVSLRWALVTAFLLAAVVSTAPSAFLYAASTQAVLGQFTASTQGHLVMGAAGAFAEAFRGSLVAPALAAGELAAQAGAAGGLPGSVAAAILLPAVAGRMLGDPASNLTLAALDPATGALLGAARLAYPELLWCNYSAAGAVGPGGGGGVPPACWAQDLGAAYPWGSPGNATRPLGAAFLGPDEVAALEAAAGRGPEAEEGEPTCNITDPLPCTGLATDCPARRLRCTRPVVVPAALNGSSGPPAQRLVIMSELSLATERIFPANRSAPVDQRFHTILFDWPPGDAAGRPRPMDAGSDPSPEVVAVLQGTLAARLDQLADGTVLLLSGATSPQQHLAAMAFGWGGLRLVVGSAAPLGALYADSFYGNMVSLYVVSSAQVAVTLALIWMMIHFGVRGFDRLPRRVAEAVQQQVTHLRAGPLPEGGDQQHRHRHHPRAAPPVAGSWFREIEEALMVVRRLQSEVPMVSSLVEAIPFVCLVVRSQRTRAIQLRQGPLVPPTAAAALRAQPADFLATLRVEAVNGRCAAELGYDQAALPPLETLLRPTDDLLAAGDPAGAGPPRAPHFLVTTAAGAQRHVAGHLVEVGEGGLLLLLLEDLTPLVADRLSCAAFTKQLHDLTQAESTGRFAGAVAHEINNALTGITLNVELLRERAGPFVASDEPLREVLAMAGRASEIVGKLLMFSRRAPHGSSHADLHRCLDTIAGLLRDSLDPRIVLRCALRAPAHDIEYDETLVRSALLNLAVNARDAMPSGGALLLATRNATLPEDAPVGGDAAWASEPLPAAAQPGRYLVVSVGDTGAGIAAPALAHLFEPFTTKPGAAGLGLAAVFGMMQDLGGWIDVATGPWGSSFALWMPLQARQGQQPVAERGDMLRLRQSADPPPRLPSPAAVPSALVSPPPISDAAPIRPPALAAPLLEVPRPMPSSPTATEPDPPTPPGMAFPPTGDGRPLSVLWAEGDLFIRALGARLMGGLGIPVRLAADGAEALEALRGAPRGTFDAVLFDLDMVAAPVGGAGLRAEGLLAQLRLLAPGLPLVALTAPASGAQEAELAALGIGCCLAKPFGRADLRQPGPHMQARVHPRGLTGLVRYADAPHHTLSFDMLMPHITLSHDDPVVRKVAERMLRHLGYGVLQACDGVEGLEQFRAHGGALGAVMLDMVMPRMGGRDAYLAMRQADPRVPVLIVSGFPGGADVEELTRAGARFLQKPYPMAVLEETLADLLRRGPDAAGSGGGGGGAPSPAL
ncbi:putative hybrid sensor histidine kinase/response regulator [Paratrimastix pyriformis]|uniref:Hybrid sensor histidine kinase/response regulator n=1 Tax=Paratrimastix pyriformis TaxID=342808 RepID=A0ABQ8UVI9_9EUKA|nr:putative hybrid sensor histidine kinase/response regulator [Paratrimastix pyriformis]